MRVQTEFVDSKGLSLGQDLAWFMKVRNTEVRCVSLGKGVGATIEKNLHLVVICQTSGLQMINKARGVVHIGEFIP